MRLDLQGARLDSLVKQLKSVGHQSAKILADLRLVNAVMEKSIVKGES
jgi:hypothetical protein